MPSHPVRRRVVRRKGVVGRKKALAKRKIRGIKPKPLGRPQRRI